METHAPVREGDEHATFALLRRLARQVVAPGRYPPGADFATWNADAVDDLISETFERKPTFVVAAIARTTTDASLERYLLEALENMLRDRGRRSERGKLVERLKTILGGDARFVRHASPFDSWRVRTAPAKLWEGDIGELLAAPRDLRGISAFAWNTSGPTPKATKDAIIRVSDAALTAADGLVRDGVVAEVVQHWVPATPLDARDVERTGTTDDVTDWDIDSGGAPERGQATRPQLVGSAIDQVGAGHPDADDNGDGEREGVSSSVAAAAAVWDLLDLDEQRALPHLSTDRGIAKALGIGRRGVEAVVASIAAKVQAATMPGEEDTVVHQLTTWARAAGADSDVAPETDPGRSPQTDRGGQS